MAILEINVVDNMGWDTPVLEDPNRRTLAPDGLGFDDDAGLFPLATVPCPYRPGIVIEASDMRRSTPATDNPRLQSDECQ